VFVHGCFWHGHDCPLFRLPESHREFWSAKIAANRARDEEVRDRILRSGWRYLAVWECAFRGRGKPSVAVIAARAARWIRSKQTDGEVRGKNANAAAN
jgi:DNA mismatch endonuclease (patch repair protein)